MLKLINNDFHESDDFSKIKLFMNKSTFFFFLKISAIK